MASGVVGIVLDSQGVAVVPQAPYRLLDEWKAAYRPAWGTLEELDASLRTAPPPQGLPENAPNPNAVIAKNGRLVRYVVDPDYFREPFVQRSDDGAEEVRERTKFIERYVALSLEGARTATDTRREDEPGTDFWCGFTWIRDGVSPERWAPSETQARGLSTAGPSLIFDQPASPTAAARIRHEVANMDRRAATLPVETTAPKRGRKAAPMPTDSAGETPPAED